MNKIIDMRKYRRQRQHQFLKKHKVRIDRVIFDTLQQTMFFELDRYLDLISQKSSHSADFSWDYISFRELIIESLDRHIGDQVYSNLKKRLWFDKRWFSRDQMLERALSNLVLRFPDLEPSNYLSA